MKTCDGSGMGSSGGFTLVELLLASGLATLVLGGVIAIYITVLVFWHGIDCRLQADRAANMAVTHMVYGVDAHLGLRAASAASVRQDADGWTLDYVTPRDPDGTNAIVYSAGEQTLTFEPGGVIVARGVTEASAFAEGGAVGVTVQVERVAGRFRAQREVGVRVQHRN
ncbi:MAG: hypothetical protein PHR35_00750 [Kiritimatiellae bacterium]|nr:hypothetical protein [Kiritimatiellia bacterium]